jgi:DNA polymerase-3 subunit delta'
VSWQRVRGHDSLIEAFDRAVHRGRLAHAYLFTGPPGVGKRLFAGELAKALLCENSPSGRLAACDRCPACLQVDAGAHPDLFVARRPEDKVEVPIEVMRELCREFSLKPARGRGKVAILDDADDLNDESANCFLKTLEEPPPRSVLLLIGTSVERQLPTILSRCQVIRFAPLSDALVDELLRAQGIADDKVRERLVRLADGSLGQAQALSDPELRAFRQKLLDALIDPRLDSVVLAKTWTESVEEAGKDAAVKRRRAAAMLRLLIDVLEDALRVNVGGTPRYSESDDLPAVQSLAARLDHEQLLALLDRCLEGDAQIDRLVQLVLVLEALVDALGQKLSPRPARSAS